MHRRYTLHTLKHLLTDHVLVHATIQWGRKIICLNNTWSFSVTADNTVLSINIKGKC